MDQADLGATSATTNGGLPDTDVLLIAGMIAKRPVCVDCLAGATNQAVTQVDEAFARLRGTLEVISEVALCDHCLKQTVVHRLG